MFSGDQLSGWKALCEQIDAKNAERRKTGIMKEFNSPHCGSTRTRRSVTWGAQTTIFFESLPVKQVERDLASELTPSEQREKAKSVDVRSLLGDAFVDGEDPEVYIRKRRKSIYDHEDPFGMENEKHTADTDDSAQIGSDPMESPPDCIKSTMTVQQLLKNSQLVHSGLDSYVMKLCEQTDPKPHGGMNHSSSQSKEVFSMHLGPEQPDMRSSSSQLPIQKPSPA